MQMTGSNHRMNIDQVGKSSCLEGLSLSDWSRSRYSEHAHKPEIKVLYEQQTRMVGYSSSTAQDYVERILTIIQRMAVQTDTLFLFCLSVWDQRSLRIY